MNRRAASLRQLNGLWCIRYYEKTESVVKMSKTINKEDSETTTSFVTQRKQVVIVAL